MPSFALKPFLFGARARKSILRSAMMTAAIALCVTGHALAQTQVAENALTTSPIDMMRISGSTSHVSSTATVVTTSLFSATSSAFYGRLTAWRTPSPNLLLQAPSFANPPQSTDYKRDRSLQIAVPHHQKGLVGGTASWIIAQAIGDDGMEDLKHGCRIAKRLALLR